LAVVCHAHLSLILPTRQTDIFANDPRNVGNFVRPMLFT
jgi:hypothetical protein